jgi:hypothetical protein
MHASSLQCPQGSDNGVSTVCVCYVGVAGKHVRVSASEKLSLHIMRRGRILHVKRMYRSCSITRNIKIVITVIIPKAVIV